MMPWVEPMGHLIGVIPWIVTGAGVAALAVGLVVDVMLPTLAERRRRTAAPLRRKDTP